MLLDTASITSTSMSESLSDEKADGGGSTIAARGRTSCRIPLVPPFFFEHGEGAQGAARPSGRRRLDPERRRLSARGKVRLALVARAVRAHGRDRNRADVQLARGAPFDRPRHGRYVDVRAVPRRPKPRGAARRAMLSFPASGTPHRPLRDLSLRHGRRGTHDLRGPSAANREWRGRPSCDALRHRQGVRARGDVVEESSQHVQRADRKTVGRIKAWT